MKFELFILGAIYLTAAQVDGQDGNETLYTCNTVVELNFTDSMTEGHILGRFVHKITLNGQCDYMEIDPNNTVVLTKNLTTICIPYIDCNFLCEGNTNMAIRGNIQRTKNYTLEFNNSNYNTKVKEMAPVSTKLKITPPVNVTMKECEYFDVTLVIHYGIKNGSGPFVWDAVTGSDSLHVAGDIDYERNKTFDLELFSKIEDFRTMATAMLHVEVEDVDDQNPKFDNDVYHLNITEENTTVVNQGLETIPPIHAFDQDTGIDMNITYTIIDQAEAGLFNIDSTTGNISVTKVLDRENKSSYSILIKATQEDNRFRIATATVSIEVIDTDDNPPKFEHDHYNVSINEHVAQGTPIVTVTATDPDEGVNAEFTYVLTSTSTSLPVKIDPNTGRLTVSNSIKFDRESFVNGIITVQVGVKSKYNHGNGSPDNTTTVTITLIDINDNNPNFTQTDYQFTAIDSTPPYILGQVSATDADAGDNANVTYSFLNSSQSSQRCQGNANGFPITVDIFTGYITVISNLYCDLYMTLVKACDNPPELSSRRCSLVQISINNDLNMTVRNVTQEMYVTENAPNGTTVGVMECPGESYEITNDAGDFRVENSSGLVLTNKVLDREESAIHHLSLNVFSSGMVVVCYVNLTVWMTDINDNAPVFMNTTSYIFNLLGSADVDLGTVKASDLDDGPNAEMSYSIESQRESRFFVNSTTGMVFETEDYVDLDIDIVRLMVVCEDHGKPSLKTTEAVFILPKDQPANLIPIRSPLSVGEINNRKTEVVSNLEQITGIELKVYEVQERGLRSVIQLEYTNHTLERRTVLGLIVDKYEEIQSTFYTNLERRVSANTEDSEFGAAEIGLVVMGAIIVIGAIVAIFIVRKQCDSAQKYKHLYESLTRNSSIYESQEIKVRMEDDTSEVTAISNTELTPISTEVVSATVNPVFQDDNDITDAVTDFGGTTEGIEGMTTPETTPEDVTDLSNHLSAGLEHGESENGNTAVYDHVNVNRADLINGTKMDDSSNNSISEQDPMYVNENYMVDVLDNDDAKDNDDDDDNDSNDEDQKQDKVESGLAQKILQASANSPVMSRRIEDDETKPNDTEELDEPDPDYDIKQVRFSTQVLDTTENKIEPLKPSKDDVDTDSNEPRNGSSKALPQTVTPVYMNTTEQSEDETSDLMLEEEISSPVDIMAGPPSEEFYFGTAEETTHF